MNETKTLPSTAAARAPAQQPGSRPSQPGRAGPAAGAGPGHRWWALAVIGLAQLMVLDVKIVNIALPASALSMGAAG